MSRFDTNKITWPDGTRGPRTLEVPDEVGVQQTEPVVPTRAYEDLLSSAERMARFLQEEINDTRAEYGEMDEVREAQAVLDDFHRGENTTDRLFLVITRQVADEFVETAPEGFPPTEIRPILLVQKQVRELLEKTA